MDIFIQQILNGLVQGSIYAVLALGYTMVYGILGMINFAHGEVLMVGALVALSAIRFLQSYFPGLDDKAVLIIALMIAMLTCALLAWIIERVAYRPLRHAPRLAPLITAIGVSLVLQTLAMLIWSRDPLMFPQLLPIKFIHLLPSNEDHPGAVISLLEITIFSVACTVMAGLYMLIYKTRLGRAMRAASENQAAAALTGVNLNVIISATFMIGAALAALAGVMMACQYGNAHFYMGFSPGLKAFTAAVLGGIGNLSGALLGGLLLGMIEQLGSGYLSELTGGILGSNYQDVFAFIVLIIVLICRPSGLLGERLAERV